MDPSGEIANQVRRSDVAEDRDKGGDERARDWRTGEGAGVAADEHSAEDMEAEEVVDAE